MIELIYVKEETEI